MKILKISTLVITIVISLLSTTPMKDNEEVLLNDSTPIIAKEAIIKDEISETIIEEEIKETPQPKTESKSNPPTNNKNTSTNISTAPKETKPINNEPKYRTDISASYERQINAYRVANGLPALPITTEAKNEANKRAIDLIRHYGHNASSGFAENIGKGTAGVDFVTAWKKSPPHNATLLRDIIHVAMAVSVVEHNGSWFVVASFKVDYSMFE